MMMQDSRLTERSDGRAPLRIRGYHTFYKSKDDNCHGLLTIERGDLAAEQIVTPRPGEHSELLTVTIWINKEPLLVHNLLPS